LIKGLLLYQASTEYRIAPVSTIIASRYCGGNELEKAETMRVVNAMVMLIQKDGHIFKT
jgi:hypothetical protein